MHRPADTLTDPDRNIAESTGAPTDVSQPVDLELITEETPEARIHTPPPRIAARFYRPTNTRRKSSAASSRRNSISSAHSHPSTSSRYGAPQSSYIAHHLRRASIIEDRKARLADRAAHAEKVRLRAALAKAAPRSTTNSEERALAAQHAREKNLAEIVASCAEEVKRAKGIAESMKERREAEGKKLRKEMEERLAEAERRREEILNRNVNRRGRSLSQPRKNVAHMPEIRESISEPAAASKIQQKWRLHQRAKALKQFSALGLTIDSVRDTSFDSVRDLLAQEKVLVSTARILRICGLKEGETGSVNEMTAVRTFLSAYLILGHPTQVLSSKGDSGDQEQVGVLLMTRDDLANPQLQDLVAKARDLLISFENVLLRLNPANNYTPPPSQLSVLSEAYATFFNAFIAWKARDSSTLIDMMVLQFVELDAIWQTVQGSTEEAVTETYREGIRENQLKLMVRIKKLAGHAQGLRLIREAMREARKARAIKKPAGDSKPRTAESPSVVRPVEDLALAEKSVSTRLQTLTPPATPQRVSRTHAADGLRNLGSIMPDNRTVVHELSMNREYRMDIEDIPKQTTIVNQLIFNTMRQEIAAGNSEPWVLSMADNVRWKLQHLLKPGNSTHALVGEVLDTDVVARQLQFGTFSYDKFFAFMAKLLPQLCAPFRDAEAKDLVETKLQVPDVVGRLQSLLHFLDLMQLDYANFMLQQNSPDLIRHACEYEVKRFSEIMENTNNDLSAARTAWTAAAAKVVTEAARRDPENVNHPRNRPTPDKIYYQMLIDVFTSIDSLSPIPETLLLDTKRILRIRFEVLRIVTAGTILLQTKTLLKRDVRSLWKTEAGRIMAVLENAEGKVQLVNGVTAALEACRGMPGATKVHLRTFVGHVGEVFEGVAASLVPFSSGDVALASPGGTPPPSASTTITLNDPIMRLLLSRLRTHLFTRLSTTTEREKVRVQSTAGESLAALGLPEFVGKIGVIVEEVARVGNVDRETHGMWYEGIMKACLKEI